MEKPNFKGALKGCFDMTVLKLKKHSPEILLGLGLTGIAVGVGLSCRATLKVSKKVDDFHELKAKLDHLKETAAIEAKEAEAEGREPEIIFDEEETNKTLSEARKNLALDLLSAFALPGVVLAGSTACILKSYGIMHNRNVRYLGLYAASQKALETYRERTRERFGDDVDMELLTGVKKKTGVVKELDEEGNEVENEKEVECVDDGTLSAPSGSMYGRWFARGTTPLWQVNTVDNECFLLSQLAYFNNRLKAEGYVILAEVYRALGFPITSESLITGWVKDSKNGDNYISFGSLIPTFEECGERVDPTGRITKRLSGCAFYLDFNVDGCIYGLI